MGDSIKKDLVLVVDDFPDNAETVGQVLQTEIDCDLLVASGGEEALKMIADTPPDLILLDVMMPGMDGYEVCSRLKKQEKFKHIPIIFLTARTDREDYLRGFGAGAVDYISKPIDIHILLARVKAQLELKHQRDWMSRVTHQYKELIRMMCHDLINPIGSLKSILECSIDEPELMEEFKGDIIGLANLSLEMIDQVRTIRKLEEGRQVLIGPVSLNEMLDETLFLARKKLQEKKIQVQLDVENDLIILGERVGLLNSVLGNLISNSVKFSDPESQIFISACSKEDKVIFVIRDHGMGIPKEIMPDLFSLAKATSRPGTQGELGAGYGMPILKRYLDLFGANVDVQSKTFEESEMDKGVCVTIEFQRSEVPEIEDEEEFCTQQINLSTLS